MLRIKPCAVKHASRNILAGKMVLLEVNMLVSALLHPRSVHSSGTWKIHVVVRIHGGHVTESDSLDELSRKYS